MKKYILLYILLLSSVILNGQDYFNRIIPFEFGNPNPLEIFDFQDKHLISVIYFSDSLDISTIIELGSGKTVDYHHYQDFNFTRQSLTLINGNLYAYAKDKSKSLDLQLARIDQNWEIGLHSIIETKGDRNYVLHSVNLDNKLYNSFGFEENDSKKFGINKSDKNLNKVWTKYYESDIGYSFPWHMSASSDNNLFMTYTLRYEDEFRSNAYVMKIDTAGEIIWRTDPMELIDGGAAPILMAELSNEKIVLTYRKNMWYDYDWWCCLVPFTPTFIFLDKDGNILSENVLKLEKSENVEFLNLKKGNGDYFYGYGRRQYDAESIGDVNYYGFITKYDNAGDTIWTKLYRHTDYNEDSKSHMVKDIIELDNGDIVAMGSITPVGEKSKIWYFKVDSEGCFSSEFCDEEIQILTEINEQEEPESNFSIFPNPCSDYLSIHSTKTIQKIELYGIDGRMHPLEYKELNIIDVSKYPKGWYFLRAGF